MHRLARFCPGWFFTTLIAAIPVTALLVVGGTGCASKTARDPEASEVDGPKMTVGQRGYKEVYQTGSNLPVLVPTSPTARPLASATPVTTMSPEAFHELVRRGQGSRR